MSSTPRNVLIVEGAKDRNFLNHVLISHGFSRSPIADHDHFIIGRSGEPDELAIEIVVAGGFNKISGKLKTVFRPDDYDGIAIVADMDQIEDNRWESLRGSLTRHGFKQLPARLPTDGLVLAGDGNPSLAIWLMPDNLSAGLLESFACRLVSPEDRAWLHATTTVADLPEGTGTFSRERDLEKAQIHTWLAWQDEPGCPLGTAVAKHYLRTDHGSVALLCDWVVRWLAASGSRRAVVNP